MTDLKRSGTKKVNRGSRKRVDRKTSVSGPSDKSVLLELKRLRKRIDQADRRLLLALSERFSTVQKIGKLKSRQGLPTKQKSRWEELLRDRIARAAKLGIDDGFTRALYSLIHDEALRIQKRIP